VSQPPDTQPDTDSDAESLASLPCPPVAHSFGLTDPGKVRPSNEDQFLIGELARTLWVRQTSLLQPETLYGRNRGHVFLVADGMGGHEAGEVASALTVRTVEAFVLHLLHRFSNLELADEQGVVADLKAALQHADARIFEEAAHHPQFTGMGTTLTLALVSGWKLFVMHAGDSRCYLYRGGPLRQLTEDHTLVGELARRGVIRPDEIRHHNLRHVVTNVLGGGEAGVRVDVHRVDLEPGDVLLVCTDGLTEMLDDARIAAVLAAEGEPQKACERLVAEANGAGGRDNVTVIVARFEPA
jgi:protein phosphatase